MGCLRSKQDKNTNNTDGNIENSSLNSIYDFFTLLTSIVRHTSLNMLFTMPFTKMTHILKCEYLSYVCRSNPGTVSFLHIKQLNIKDNIAYVEVPL